MQSRVLPRLPILSWSAFKGARHGGVPSLLDAQQLVYTQSGRAAIALALRLLAVGPGDRVLVPTFHCPTMIAPVVAAGAEPVFYALDATGYPSMDHLHSLGSKPARAMLAAHYFGLPRPMASLRRFCDLHDMALIEDCAHTFFGSSDGRPVGSWGDFAIASLTKFFPVPEGGCLASGSRSLGDQALPRRSIVAELRTAFDAIEIGSRHEGFPGLNTALRATFELKTALLTKWRSSDQETQHKDDVPGSARYLAALNPTQPTRVARWIVQHASLSSIVSARRRNYLHLIERLSDIPGLQVLHPTLPEGAVPYVLPLLAERPEARYHRLRISGVPIFRWDDTWTTMPKVEGDVGVIWARSLFQLGCHQDLRLDDLETIARQLRWAFDC
jgi:perosamine synthetase